MLVCPNTNTKEWKMLLSHLNGNEEAAYKAYMAHNYTIPPVLPLGELKKILGLTSAGYSSDRQLTINRKLRIYNQQNGTSHFIEYKPFGSGELSYATLKFNYLPVNKLKQESRDRRRSMVDYGFLQDIDSFEGIYNPMDYQASESEQEAGRFEEGDFVPPADYFPADQQVKAGPKFRVLIESKEADRKTLYRDRDKLYLANKKATTVEQRRRISDLLSRVNEKIRKIEQDILDLSNEDKLDNVEKYAEQDMRTLEIIFSKANPTFQDLTIADRIIHIWDQAGTFDGSLPHLFFDPDEVAAADTGLKEIADKFKSWRDRALSYNVKLIELEEKMVEREMKDRFKGLNSVDFKEPLKDMNAFWSHVLDISEADNVIFQYIHTKVKDANQLAHTELIEIKREIDRLVNATGLRDFNIFRQTFSNDSDKLTGDIVTKFTREFHEMIDNALRRREKAKDFTGKNMGNFAKANLDLIEKLREQTEVIDARIFFPDAELWKGEEYTSKEREEAETRLRQLLGDRGFEEYYEKARKKVEEYKFHRAAQKDFYETEMGETAADLLASWELANSPYYHAELMDKGYAGVSLNKKRSFPSLRYVDVIPKQESYYDQKYKEIEDTDSYYELYTYMINILEELKRYFPTDKVSFMSMNSLPFMAKKVSEIFLTDGMAAGMGAVRDEMKKAVRVDDLSTIDTELDTKELQVQMLQNNKKRILEYITLKDTEYRADNDTEPDADQIEEWRRKIIDEIAKEKSFDLDRVLKAFASTALGYRHKANIEDQILTMRRIIERSLERKTNAAGDQKTDIHGNKLAKKGLENSKKMLDSYLDTVYWGYKSDKPMGKTTSRILTEKEKIAKEALEKSLEDLEQLYADKKISQTEYEARLDIVNDQLQTLGGVATWSKYGDLVLKYIQIKGMGWNVIAAFANLGFGFITNVVEASDGRNYSANSFWRAQAMVLNSLPGVNKITDNGKKIRELVYRFDALKEAKNEIYEGSKTGLFRRIGDKLDWANPYAPQSRTEYMNQAPVMIAMMMDEKVKMKTEDGETEISLWEAYNVDGTLKEGVEFSERQMLDFKVRVDKLIKMNHGNYDPDSKTQMKRTVILRAASQFRTWMFQGFAERFKDEFKDYQLKNIQTGEDFVIRKGRYKSYGAYWTAMREQHGLAGLGAPVYIVLELARKMVGRRTTFDGMVNDQFTEVDAANMRKNMTEIVLYLMITAFNLLLRASIDDEDDPRRKAPYYFLINSMFRLSTDIMLYTNPVEFERLSKNIVPAFSLVTDAWRLSQSAAILISGGEDILQSGPNKGESRTWRDFKRMLPFTSQLQRMKSISAQTYNK